MDRHDANLGYFNRDAARNHGEIDRRGVRETLARLIAELS